MGAEEAEEEDARCALESMCCPQSATRSLMPPISGFARRYFTLSASGVLSYSFEPGQPARDEVLLTQAAISTAPGRKDIHVDSHTATFHIKCLSMDDFDMWMGAFR